MTERITGGRDVPLQRARVRSNGWTRERRKRFLDMLAETCNVSLSVQSTGMSVTGAYQLRRRDPAFAALWREALEMGYDRLEQALLAHALQGVNAIEIGIDADDPADAAEAPEDAGAPVRTRPIPGSGLARTIGTADVQLALTLLNRHRASVEGKGPPRNSRRRASSEETDAALRQKLDRLARKLRTEA